VLGKRYEEQFEKASNLLRDFNTSTGYQHAQIGQDGFRELVMRAEAAGSIPSGDDPKLEARFLLPKIIQDTTDLAVMQRIMDWVAQKFPV
jgi:hypothetical protein